MLLAVVACGVGLAAVLVVLYRDEPLPVRRTAADWGPLPTPAEVAGTTFPLSFRGYEPGTVDAHLERLRQAYGDVLAVAPPEVIQRARERAVLRGAHTRLLGEHGDGDECVDDTVPSAPDHRAGQHEPQAPVDPDSVGGGCTVLMTPMLGRKQCEAGQCDD